MRWKIVMTRNGIREGNIYRRTRRFWITQRYVYICVLTSQLISANIASLGLQEVAA